LSMFFVLLTYRPSMLFQAGFQMSYMAVFAILWIYPKLERLWRPRYWVLKKFWQLLSVSLAAQMGVLPISLYYFHQFPGLFFISNLLVLPFLGILLAIGYIAAVLALSDLLPSGLMAAYGVLINGMNSLISWIAGQEAFLFQDLPFDFPRLICSYLIIGALTTILDGAKYRKLVFLFTGIIGLQLWAAYQAFRIRDKEAVWVLQQPHNTVLIHQAGNRMEVASGTEKPAGELLSGLLVGGGVKSVEKRPLHPAYLWKTSVLYILNDSGALPVCMDKNVYLLLTHSPKIHLERILKDVSPRGVIADGSNYSSYVARWKASCKAQQIPFHDTATQGAYMLPME